MEQNTYGFIGLGLIGGSLAKALKRTDPSCRILAYTRTRATLEEALKAQAVDAACSSVDDPQFATCSCIFLCAPVATNISALRVLKDIVSPDCILTDVGSVKTDIHLAASEMGLDGRFIGGHPMTGSEKSGFAHAQAHLFENAYYIITPSKDTAQEKIDWYRQTVQQFGALPVILNYREHDYATAAISHLPHLIAAALVNTVHDLDSREAMMKMLAAGGFKDITRIASSSPEMWEQICSANSENILSVLDEYINSLIEIKFSLAEHNTNCIHDLFETSRDYRNSISDSGSGPIPKAYSIYCDMVDEAGGIAALATILATNGISIKNIGIVHNREFEEAVLHVEFYEEMAKIKAAELLRKYRYTIYER